MYSFVADLDGHMVCGSVKTKSVVRAALKSMVYINEVDDGKARHFRVYLYRAGKLIAATAGHGWHGNVKHS